MIVLTGELTGIQSLVDGNEHTQLHKCCNKVVHREIHHIGDLTNGDKFGDLQDAFLLLSFLSFHLLLLTDGFAF